MSARDLSTRAVNTWCPGCGNFAILNALKSVLGGLPASGAPLERVVLVSGIGCHAKIADYLNVHSFYSIHGRGVAVAEGLKLANPGLTVISCAGDGDAYGEGIEHLIFAAKRNLDITVLVHDNRVYGLTTGQCTPTSPPGFRGRSTPDGSREDPLNPLTLMLAAGATFVARGYSNRMDLLKETVAQAMRHRGFSLVEVLQVCVTFYNLYADYNKRVYELEGHDPADFDAATARAREWNYGAEGRIALGVFYRAERPSFEQGFAPARPASRRAEKIRALLAGRM
ncbi:MAG: thiamine pyrophosphate-dependent enzyme [Chlamydiota bacterium]